jgi:hypothetical protein
MPKHLGIIEDSDGENLDDLVIRARRDPELQRILRAEETVDGSSEDIGRGLASQISISYDDKIIAYLKYRKLHLNSISAEEKLVEFPFFPFDSFECDAIGFYPFRVNEKYVLAVALNRDINLAFFTPNDKEWEKIPVDVADRITGLAFSRDGKYLAVTCEDELKVFGFDANSMTIKDEQSSKKKKIQAIAFSENKLFTASRNRVEVIERWIKPPIHMQVEGYVTSLAVDEKHKHLYVAACEVKSLYANKDPQEENSYRYIYHCGLYDFDFNFITALKPANTYGIGKNIGAAAMPGDIKLFSL